VVADGRQNRDDQKRIYGMDGTGFERAVAILTIL